ncbi:MAG: SufD family Fe-S cluster assembly protein [Lachnospiraceae bacterium]|nr:SufD family Fe-S cluster assembly protein [Lachnospiraceae bacterium]
MNEIEKRIIEEVADLHEVPMGAYNFRVNSKLDGRNTTENIDIRSKADGTGIDIIVKPGTKKESVHIPVVLSAAGLKETVYNDFYVGAGADVLIVAGCGIHNCGEQDSEHDGVHRFFLEKGAKVKYVEKHYGEGTGSGKRILNPVTEATLDEDASMEMEMVQIEGVSSTKRVTTAKLGKGASLIVHERLMTHGDQSAYSEYTVELNGENSSANVVSRSVAKDRSYQKFVSRLHGNAKSAGHSECDSIIMDHAKIDSIPEILANSTDAELIHEAAIGKIAGDQIMKLMTLGLSEAEAESEIVNGFLK